MTTTAAKTLQRLAEWCERHQVQQIVGCTPDPWLPYIHLDACDFERIVGGRGDPAPSSDKYEHRESLVDGIRVVALFPLAPAAQPPLPSGGDLDGAGLGGGD